MWPKCRDRERDALRCVMSILFHRVSNADRGPAAPSIRRNEPRGQRAVREAERIEQQQPANAPGLNDCSAHAVFDRRRSSGRFMNTSTHQATVQRRFTSSKPARATSCSMRSTGWTNVRNGLPCHFKLNCRSTASPKLPHEQGMDVVLEQLRSHRGRAKRPTFFHPERDDQSGHQRQSCDDPHRACEA
jgi:hypothetical protein